jgi:hypothetical protein
LSSTGAADQDGTVYQDDTALVVPIDVVGLCVGEDDAQQATNHFAGATSVYTDQSSRGAYLGDDVSRDYGQSPADQLEVGVHLHWALPDGLTRGGGRGHELDFPAVPNRWLVTRIAVSGGQPAARSWLVSSDALRVDKPPAGVASVTLPVQPTDQAPEGFCYLGWSQPAGPGWTGEAQAGGPAFADAAGGPLSAVSNGEVGFAAYYPSCRGVFGFRDSLDDLSPPASQPAELAYSVIGWYADAGHDPVQPGSTPDQLQKTRGWTFAPGSAPPVRSVYPGVLTGVEWSPQRAYIHGQDVQKPAEIRAAIGNTASEALAAYFMARDHPGEPLFETMLDAFQSGLLEAFTQPRPNDLAEMAERLHAQRFAATPGGTSYSIVDADDQGPDSAELIDLPAPLGDDLDTLNLGREHADQYAGYADWYRWQLFADWYRIFMVDQGDQTHAFQIAMDRADGWGDLSAARDTAETAARDQLTAVQNQLGPGMRLRGGPAERFCAPADPAVVISAGAAQFPARYGGDGRFNADGYLVCRTGDQLLSAVAAGGTTLTAASLAAVAAPDGLAGGPLLTALLREACLLWPGLLAARAGIDAATLQKALELALKGKPQDVYALTGRPPSPVGVNWWAAGLFLPIFASWTVEYLPLQPTMADTKPVSYESSLVTANYLLDQDAGGTLAYAPSGRPGSIKIDPATAVFRQQYTGGSNLSATPAQTLARLLSGYLGTHTDPTLGRVLEELTSGDGFLVLPLNGLVEALTMRQRGVQLQIRVPDDSHYADLTEAIAGIAGDAARGGGPDFNGYFNPLRAGYLKLALTLVDVFGQKRETIIPTLTCASSMTTTDGNAVVPSVAYLAPRIAQPSRLAFRWLAADGTDAEEMTGNPAVSPVCGWLLPNHADGSVAVYDQQGRPLVLLFPDGQAVGWQSAPGSALTISQNLAAVMADQNPGLRAVVLSLAGPGATARTLAAMMALLDAAGETTDPGPVPTDSDLAVLVGRPIAVVQASVRLELQGAALFDLHFAAMDADSNAGLTGIEFPVILGNLTRLRDGLVGYFKQAAPGASGEYDLGTFYAPGAGPGEPETEDRAADPAVISKIVRPGQDNLLVTPFQAVDPASPFASAGRTGCAQHVLMLLDPRSQVHATCGILPVTTLELPPSMAQATMSSLDLFLFSAPVLRGADGLAIPVPAEDGYALSFIDQDQDADGRPEWVVTPDIAAPGDGVWAYTPQQVREGWLRLNPIVLDFALTDSAGRPVVVARQASTLNLTVTNRARRAVTLRQGTPVAEGAPPPGSVFYIHFGTLVAADAVARIGLAAHGWTFRVHSSPQYGTYWAASPDADVRLGDAASFSVTVTGLVPAPAGGQARVSFDYYAIDGIDDGVSADEITVRPAAPRPVH